MKSDPGWVKPLGLGVKQLPGVVNSNPVPQKWTPKNHKSAGNETLSHFTAPKKRPESLQCSPFPPGGQRRIPDDGRSPGSREQMIPVVLQEKDGEPRTPAVGFGDPPSPRAPAAGRSLESCL